MSILLVVNNPENWPLSTAGVEVVAARQYLTDPRYAELRNVRVFNLCRSYAYKSLGYYVSLLAEARGHKPVPDTLGLQDMKSSSLVRLITDDLDRLVQKTLKRTKGRQFTLSIYFGRTVAQRDHQLGRRLFGLFRSPMLRAQFVLKRGKWLLQSIRPIAAAEIPESHTEQVIAAADAYFSRGTYTGPIDHPPRYSMAILIDPDEKTPPSDAKALARFVRAAQILDMSVEMITRDDINRLGAFDALFIRTTTFVNHYTYRFARRAAAEGLAVIDDPTSIARCTNKVYLAERMALHDVPIPRTIFVSPHNAEAVLQQLGLPCVLKQPDSAFSAGVMKVETEEEYRKTVAELLDDSELIVAQEFMPTDFDWRIGVLDNRPLYACKYHMARRHWQILQRKNGRLIEGACTNVPLDRVPAKVLRTAVRAARLIGDGLYGVDLKQVGQQVYLMEVNENPNIDAGAEDKLLKEELYLRVMSSFVRRIEAIRQASAHRARLNGQSHPAVLASGTAHAPL